MPELTQAAEIERLKAALDKEKLPSLNQRGWDLLRQMRHKLFEEKLITGDEYGELIQIPGAVKRLEDYDEALKEIERLNRELEEARLDIQAINAIRVTAEARVKELEWQQKIFTHKHLDPQCVETGCRSLFEQDYKERLAALISAAEPLMNWPAQDFDGKSYRTIPADLFNGFATAVEKVKAVT